MTISTSDPLLDMLNRATYEALELMKRGESPKLECIAYYRAGIEVGKASARLYPNGCPILPEGPQRDDL